jgi:hypothetical protein
MYRLLNRAGDLIKDANYYLLLHSVLRSPLQSILFDGDRGELTESRLWSFEYFLSLDPLISSSPQLEATPRAFLEMADALVKYLRARDALGEGDQKLLKGSRINGLAQHLYCKLNKLQSPFSGLKIPTPYRCIRSIGELRALAGCGKTPCPTR